MEEALKEKLKQIALTSGENLAKLGTETAVKLIEAIVEDTENKIDDAAFEFVHTSLLPKLYELIDTIDNISGNLEVTNV